jgi:hypothetical protein
MPTEHILQMIVLRRSPVPVHELCLVSSGNFNCWIRVIVPLQHQRKQL